jgi:hypothetical protein
LVLWRGFIDAGALTGITRHPDACWLDPPCPGANRHSHLENDTDGKCRSLFSAAAWCCGNWRFPAAVIELDAVTKGSQ